MARGVARGPRKKVCKLCLDRVDYIDYKDEKRLNRAITDRGKIVPRRVSGNCARHQRLITRAVRRARILALLPFQGDSFK
ncbi:MAG: 30S ribosomal protein S18 [Candidatus Eisenbacteria bacterium]|uniref:Small ribosomal subunit protein bS18 n=1 Tax=Eiseniibacteriota bacterium TaxID=2212470 RepID=A0A948RRQ4_UNCEI|nr:30S ribosomal protein S18 [Candidatus Eisenbacteria bacterium]MBU1950661.1 30S ribosomal protein S18 [Candidatus Eisenbacteria bacterium]MBU2689640.1 30S ribosomal protein S18 [Candidatus Eisenbacteria bacterium]